MTKQTEAMKLALEAYMAAGFGNSTDFALQRKAYDLAMEALALVNEVYQEQPAQRTWVHATAWRGLTDEELRQVWYDDAPVQGGTYIDKLRQVETKLKEKNT